MDTTGGRECATWDDVFFIKYNSGKLAVYCHISGKIFEGMRNKRKEKRNWK